MLTIHYTDRFFVYIPAKGKSRLGAHVYKGFLCSGMVDCGVGGGGGQG